MHFAKAFTEEPARFRTIPMPMGQPDFADAFQGDGNVLVEWPGEDLDIVLPERSTFVDLHCCILGDTYTGMTFAAESEMAAVLDVKGATRGRSTNRLGQRDCHAWLGPLDIPESLRGSASIAYNRTITLPRSDVQISALDVNQALSCAERFGTILGIDSPLL